MTIKTILLPILLFTGLNLIAQDQDSIFNPRPLNNINLNIFGDASLISVNYERQFSVNSKFLISSKFGIGYNQTYNILSTEKELKYLTLPHHITGNLGKGRHFFEFGLGGTAIIGNTNKPYFLYPLVGYRILPLRSNKLNFRVFGHIPFSEGRLKEANGAGAPVFIYIGWNLGISI